MNELEAKILEIDEAIANLPESTDEQLRKTLGLICKALTDIKIALSYTEFRRFDE